jgi:hypothetical protein
VQGVMRKFSWCRTLLRIHLSLSLSLSLCLSLSLSLSLSAYQSGTITHRDRINFERESPEDFAHCAHAPLPHCPNVHEQPRDQVRGQLRNVAARLLSSGAPHHERVALGRSHNRRGRRRPVPAARRLRRASIEHGVFAISYFRNLKNWAS